MRIIVCGGRDFANRQALWAALNTINHSERGPIRQVVHGNARGADAMAGAWARENKITEWPVPAEWSKYGNSAGPRRNKQMLGMDIDLVVAFPGGRGTKNMVKQARSRGVEVIEPIAIESP